MTPSGRLLGLTLTAFAVVGSLTGLIVGLVAYVPTAPFAAVEVGAPAALLGLVVGALLVALRWCALAVVRRRTRPH